jgi:hypothetical protein
MPDERPPAKRGPADRAKVSLRPLSEDDALRGLLATPPPKNKKPETEPTAGQE